MDATHPLIVQSDRTILLEVGGPNHAVARDAISAFAELEKSPEHVHTYRITALSVWNAAAGGASAEDVVSTLERFSRYPVPSSIARQVEQWVERYGKVRLESHGDELRLVSDDPLILTELRASKALAVSLVEGSGPDWLAVDPARRGAVKQTLIRLGYPVEDVAGYVEGGRLDFELAPALPDGTPFGLRPYQQESVDAFWRNGAASGGSGVVALPCGAGKTVVAIGAMHRCRRKTLVLTTNTIAVRQWRRELLEKTTLTEDEVGEYTGETKLVRPVTIATYQILTYRRSKTGEFAHFDLFRRNDWGLIVYDEVHLLPAPVFRVTAEIQATRRLGLTATLVREDGNEEDVFTLIGPRRFDVPWKVLEAQGWIAAAECSEIRVPLPEDQRVDYATAGRRAQFRLASENPAKVEVVQRLVAKHAEDQVLVIGQYLDQLDALAAELDAPLITGRTPTGERQELYSRFRAGELRLLLVSKVGNFAVDLPDANVLIQVSGTFGSRQEEAQRLGRVLRPKSDGGTASFYSLVSRDTRDQEFAANRQLFLTEQGYSYRIVDEHEID